MEKNKDTSLFIIVILIVVLVGALFWLLVEGNFIDPSAKTYDDLEDSLNLEATPENGYGVKVANDTNLGSYLAGPNGHTLYTTTLKECGEACLQNWPPYIVSAPQDSSSGPIGVVSFGSLYQQTYNNVPLYYYIGDEEPGDINGHALNGVWFVARP